MLVKGKIRESLELGLKNSAWSHHIQMFREAISELNASEAERESTEKAKREAVKDIISYILPDEERSYYENPSDGHIYLKLIKAIELFGIDGEVDYNPEGENE